MGSEFEMRTIIREATAKDGKTNNGMFLVEWKPSFVSKNDLDKSSWEDFNRRGPSEHAKILGPVKNKKMKTIFGCDWAVQFPKKLEIMKYETLVDHFPQLLISFYEKKVRVANNKENESSDDEA